MNMKTPLSIFAGLLFAVLSITNADAQTYTSVSLGYSIGDGSVNNGDTNPSFKNQEALGFDYRVGHLFGSRSLFYGPEVFIGNDAFTQSFADGTVNSNLSYGLGVRVGSEVAENNNLYAIGGWGQARITTRIHTPSNEAEESRDVVDGPYFGLGYEHRINGSNWLVGTEWKRSKYDGSIGVSTVNSGEITIDSFRTSLRIEID